MFCVPESYRLMSGFNDSNSVSHMATSDSCTPPWAVICVNMLVWKRLRNRCTSCIIMRSIHCGESRAALVLTSLCCIDGGGMPILADDLYMLLDMDLCPILRRIGEYLPLRKHTACQPCRSSLFVSRVETLTQANQELRVLPLTCVTAQSQCGGGRHTCKGWRWIGDEADVRHGPSTYD